MLVWAWMCYMYTLVDWWWIALIGIVAAAGMWPVLKNWWRKRWNNKWIGLCVHFLFIISVLSCIIMCGNYYGASSFEHEDAEVTRKFSEERTRKRRISRRIYVDGAKYRVYFIDVTFKNGFTKKFSVTGNEYKKLRKGNHVGAEVGKGLFGLTVVKMQGRIKVDQEQSRRSLRRSRMKLNQ
ncbi:MAG: hypothetical protein K2O12_06775 [Muribaculaceae bacterium]|nr:hypothetical protein [Muribaculaceae bacterium]